MAQFGHNLETVRWAQVVVFDYNHNITLWCSEVDIPSDFGGFAIIVLSKFGVSSATNGWYDEKSQYIQPFSNRLHVWQQDVMA